MAVGTQTKFGIIPAGTWHTAVNLAANCLVKSREVGPLVPAQEMLQDDTHQNTVFPEQIDKGMETPELTFSGDLRYENAHWFHICQLLGDDATTGTASPYTHVIAMDEDPTYFYTAAALVDTMVFEWPSVKAQSFEITSGDDGIVKFTCIGIADTVLIATDATNTSTTIGTTATFDTETKRVLVGHSRIRINAQAGAALGTSDDINAKASIRFARPYVREFLSSADVGTSNEWKTSEPQQDGMLTDVTLTLEFPELTTDDYLEAFQDQSLQKAEVYYYQNASAYVKFEFPNLNPLQPDISANTPGRLPHTAVYQALKAPGTGPTGMTFTQPVRLTVVNTYGSSYHDNT